MTKGFLTVWSFMMKIIGWMAFGLLIVGFAILGGVFPEVEEPKPDHNNKV